MHSQLTLFDPEVEKELREELKQTKEQINNLRRGLFGRFDQMVNELTSLQEDISKIRATVNIPDELLEKTDLFNYDEERNGSKILELPLRIS